MIFITIYIVIFVNFFGFFHGLDPSNHKIYLSSNATILTFTYLHKIYYIPGGKKLEQILVALEPSLAVDTFAAAVASLSSNSTQYSISTFLIKFVKPALAKALGVTHNL